MARAVQILWVLEHLDDLAADFLAIYGKEIAPEEEDYGGLSGPRFFSLARRASSYDGVMAVRVLEQEERLKHEVNEGAKSYESVEEALETEPAFAPQPALGQPALFGSRRKAA